MNKINSIIDLSMLPEKVAVSQSYDLSIAISEISESYTPIPSYLFDDVINCFKSTKVVISDVGIESGTVEVYDSKEAFFERELITDYISETGLQSFLVEVIDSNTFLLGVDLDFVLILSPKCKGFISTHGGKNHFIRKAREEYDSKNSGITVDIFSTLIRAVEQSITF